MQRLFNKSGRVLRRTTTTLVALVIGASGVISYMADGRAQALTGSEFKAGHIISDQIFFNGQDMAATTIQQFLESKVPTCDTNGTQPYGGTTRAEYGAANGYPAPYTCLKDYRETTPIRNAETGLCTGLGAGDKTAAQIIYEVGVSCGVNPKVLIVLLQKEQSLVTDDWPWSVQYRSATGYGCPDTAPCDAEYYGFFNQVYMAARQFKRYARNSNEYTYQARANNFVQYNPSTTCGGSTIYIENQATAGLYNYTPYQPNQEALNNLYGSGDSCSAYGNRNFWRMYNDWFGRSVLDCNDSEQPSGEVMRLYDHRTYKHFYTVYPCEASVLQTKLGYKLEGAAYYQVPGDSPYAVVVHRLYNPQTYRHLWATTQEDINNATQKAGYRYEGVAYFAVKPEVPNHVPVHRLYNPQTYQHLWVTTQSEIDIATQKAGFRYEGVAFYAAPPPATP